MEQKQIKNWIKYKRDFVLYRLPQKASVQAYLSLATTTLSSCEELKSLGGCFIFAPFEIGRHPIIAFKQYQSFNFVPPILYSQSEDGKSAKFSSPISADYRKAFDSCLERLRDEEFGKLVLSRCQDGHCEAEALSLFYLLCQNCPNSMVYLYHSSESGMWMGATPELLVEGNQTQMHTVALAGTMVQENGVPKMNEWSKKNLEEQKVVADYLRDSIRLVGSLKDEFGPYSAPAAHLAHLKTDIYFQANPKRLHEFLSMVHPTPAVCGLPKQKALQFIHQIERFDREYYTGFLGWLDASATSHLYVNLRCMKWLDDENVRLYGGGGLLSTSDIESEWRETENKMQTLGKLCIP